MNCYCLSARCLIHYVFWHERVTVCVSSSLPVSNSITGSRAQFKFVGNVCCGMRSWPGRSKVKGSGPHTHTHKTQTEPLVNAETTSRRKFTLCASLFLMWHMQYNYSVENILHLTKIFMIGERSKISNVINVCSCCLLIKSLKILPIRLCYYRRFICQG